MVTHGWTGTRDTRSEGHRMLSDARDRQTSRAAASWVAIIDDHPSLRSSLGRALRLEGIRSDVFASAEEFLDHRFASPPCCLVVDVHLPGLSGHQLVRYLEHARPPVPPTIFMSGHDD